MFAPHLNPKKLWDLRTWGQPLLMLFLATLFAMPGCQDSQLKLHLANGSAELEKRNFSLAEEHFSQALESNPGSVAALLGRGKAFEGQNEPLKAAEDYERAFKLQPEGGEAGYRLVNVLVETGHGRTALEHFATMNPEPTMPDLLLLRGRARLQADLDAAAQADFESVLDQNAQNAAAHYYRGLAYAKLGKFPAAEADFTTALNLDPANAKAYWQRGLIRERRGEKDLATADRTKAAELDPRLNFAETQIGKNMIENLTGQGSEGLRLEPFTTDIR